MNVDGYAIELAADAIESHAEDDIDEDGMLDSDDDHEAACDLALQVAQWIRHSPDTVLGLVRGGTARQEVADTPVS